MITVTLTTEERDFLVELLSMSASDMGACHVCGDDDTPIYTFFPDPSKDSCSYPTPSRPKEGMVLFQKLKKGK